MIYCFFGIFRCGVPPANHMHSTSCSLSLRNRTKHCLSHRNSLRARTLLKRNALSLLNAVIKQTIVSAYYASPAEFGYPTRQVSATSSHGISASTATVFDCLETQCQVQADVRGIVGIERLTIILLLSVFILAGVFAIRQSSHDIFGTPGSLCEDLFVVA